MSYIHIIFLNIILKAVFSIVVKKFMSDLTTSDVPWRRTHS